MGTNREQLGPDSRDRGTKARRFISSGSNRADRRKAKQDPSGAPSKRSSEATTTSMSDPIPTDIISEKSLDRQLPEISREQIIRALDFAVLKPDAHLADVTTPARVVEDMGFASICVASYNVAVAKQITPRVCSVIGFPHGNTSPQIKFLEAAAAIEDGAVELDVVINYGRFLEGRDTVVVQELGRIVQLAHTKKVLVKAILETCYYQPGQIIEACRLCVDCGVDFVKTSTGFGLWRGDALGRGTDAGRRGRRGPSQGQRRHQDLRRCGTLPRSGLHAARVVPLHGATAMKRRMNRLALNRGYLCGAMDRVTDGGVGWRQDLIDSLKDLKILWLDPLPQAD